MFFEKEKGKVKGRGWDEKVLKEVKGMFFTLRWLNHQKDFLRALMDTASFVFLKWHFNSYLKK